MVTYILVLVIGFAGGAICIYVLLEGQHRRVKEMQRLVDSVAEKQQRTAEELRKKQTQVESQAVRLRSERTAFDARSVTFTDLQNENSILKRDLRNLDIATRKLQLDRDAHRTIQEQLIARGNEFAGRYLKDNVRWINSTLSPHNYTVCKQRLEDVIVRCRDIGFDVTPEHEAELLGNLQAAFEDAVRAAFEREEQARIKSKIREEARVERERERELQQAELERSAIQAALDQALRETHGQYDVQIQELRARLAEAEARSERAISMAQLTKAGHVYVISNIGSFGDGVFKIGMTRRLEPMDRVKELGDASVPFPFDVHMMISCDDAPTLETALHRELHNHRLNRLNPRKEFFRSEIETIRSCVERNHGVVEYVADPAAFEYRQSLAMTDEDQEFIDQVYEATEQIVGDADLEDEIE